MTLCEASETVTQAVNGITEVDGVTPEVERMLVVRAADGRLLARCYIITNEMDDALITHLAEWRDGKSRPQLRVI